MYDMFGASQSRSALTKQAQRKVNSKNGTATQNQSLSEKCVVLNTKNGNGEHQGLAWNLVICASSLM
jgi:hypothetical protein